MLIAQALERTSRPPAGAAERRPGAGAGAGAGQAPRAPGMHREELQRLLAERKAAAARGIKESALRGPGAGGPGGPRFGGPRPGGPGGPGGARFGGPRRGGQGAGAGPGGAPNPYAPVRRPPRKSFKPRFERVVSEYKPPWTKEELTPRKPPATVDTPKLQLDALVAANTYVRNSIAEQICKEVKLKPFSSNPKERAAAEKIFQGDYSQFLVQAPGKDKDGKDEVLARAMEALLHNPTVSFARRQEFVDKMRESMPQ